MIFQLPEKPLVNIILLSSSLKCQGNHNGSLDNALNIVRSAAESGAHALKLQTYTADTMTIDKTDGDFYIDNPESLWHGRSLYELYHEAHTPWEWHKPIFDLAKDLGMAAFSSPFDASAVDFLESLDVPCYKIASFENIDIPLIRKVASTGKPMIISTGMATLVKSMKRSPPQGITAIKTLFFCICQHLSRL